MAAKFSRGPRGGGRRGRKGSGGGQQIMYRERDAEKGLVGKVDASRSEVGDEGEGMRRSSFVPLLKWTWN